MYNVKSEYFESTLTRASGEAVFFVRQSENYWLIESHSNADILLDNASWIALETTRSLFSETGKNEQNLITDDYQ